MTITRAELAALLSFREPPIELLGAEAETADGFIVERLRLAIEGVGPVRGFLTRPIAPAAGRRPAILYAHSHGDGYEVGASELIDGREYLQGAYGPALARAGYVALCIDMPVFGDRQAVTESAATKAHLWYGTSLIGQMLSEEAAALTYLTTRDDVDAGRIGILGMSMGATLACWGAALDGRIRAVAQLCCYADYATLIQLGAHDNHGIYLTVPGLLAATSTGEIAGLVAPRPQLICLGEEDELTPRAAIDQALAVTRPLYEAAGAAGALEVLREPGVGHRETPAMRERVLGFFERELRPRSGA